MIADLPNLGGWAFVVPSVTSNRASSSRCSLRDDDYHEGDKWRTIAERR